METHKIFSKLNIRDYNNELERILEEKLFSLDVKNLLLSMLYKIETAYKDFNAIKREILPKKEFIEYLLRIINDKCSEIEFIKPSGENEEYDRSERMIDVKEGKIKCEPNEKSLLSAIWYMGERNIDIHPIYEYTKVAIEDMLRIGNNINQTEVIRDFNGWSWDIVVKEIEDISYNLIYQSLLLLYGKDFNYLNVEINKEDGNKGKTFESDIYKKEEFVQKIYELSMINYLHRNSNKKEEIINIKKEKVEILELFQDKKKFIEKITDDKKQYNDQIEKIDRIINDTTLLRQEYVNRNSKLPNKDKIFSISHLAEGLEKERKELLENIKQCNQMMMPKEFVKKKEELEQEINFLNNLQLENKENLYQQESFIYFVKEILKKVEQNIGLLDEKDEIIDWMYKIRYYEFVPVNENMFLKDVIELEDSFKNVIQQITRKAQEHKIWEKFCEDEELTYEVLKGLFQSKIINFENVNINCKYENEILYLQYYDASILEKEVQIKVKSVKIKRKIKLFI